MTLRGTSRGLAGPVPVNDGRDVDAGIPGVMDQIEDFLAWPQVRESASEEPLTAHAERFARTIS